MNARCYLCKNCESSTETCCIRGPIKDMFYGYCTGFESAATTKYLHVRKPVRNMREEPHSECNPLPQTDSGPKQKEMNEPDISIFKRGKVLYWYADKSDPHSWKLLYSALRQLGTGSISKLEIENAAVYGKECKGFVFKKTIRRQGVKVVSPSGKEICYNNLDTCAAGMKYSAKAIAARIRNKTKDSDGNTYEYYLYDEDIPYRKFISYY